MPILPRLIIDSSAAPTELCMLGHQAGTDKTPYNVLGHRHPYTAVYSLLFAHLKRKPVRMAEIGVAMGASAELWCKYFRHPDARFSFFDRDVQLLEATEARVGDARMRMDVMDVSVDGDVARALAAGIPSGEEGFDIILDDSSHNHEHQIRIIKEAFPHLKSGGMLIIEDIFRATPEKEYEDLIQSELEGCAEAFFIVCEHKNRWSPGWDNDKLLVLVKA